MRTIGLACLILLSSGCATTRQIWTNESGFLGDYGNLEAGDEGQALWRYLNPEADFARYNSVMIESVGLWYQDDSHELPPEDEEALTAYLYAALHRELARDYEIVSEPGPDVMRVRAAITGPPLP